MTSKRCRSPFRTGETVKRRDLCTGSRLSFKKIDFSVIHRSLPSHRSGRAITILLSDMAGISSTTAFDVGGP